MVCFSIIRATWHSRRTSIGRFYLSFAEEKSGHNMRCDSFGSSRRTTNGILWGIESDNQPTGGPAILHAYNALLADQELYNSSQAGTRDTAGPAVKFAAPTVADGHVFVGTATELDVYGLLSQP